MPKKRSAAYRTADRCGLRAFAVASAWSGLWSRHFQFNAFPNVLPLLVGQLLLKKRRIGPTLISALMTPFGGDRGRPFAAGMLAIALLTLGLPEAVQAAPCSANLVFSSLNASQDVDISACDASDFGAYAVQGTDANIIFPLGNNPNDPYNTSNAHYAVTWNVADSTGHGIDTVTIKLISVPS
ncbi:MAG TPA: hypothetical protein VE267_19605, partial [Bradyrhizobium sp.]|nr:hypothetical protein [Bradyrhizobium sp.]